LCCLVPNNKYGSNLKIDLNFLYVLNIFLEFGLTLLSSVLGSFPILFDVLYNMIKYWCHIAKSDGNNILLLESLKESEQLEKAKHDSWV
jgi:hypothetical protein